MVTYDLVDRYQRFGGTYCFHLHGRRVRVKIEVADSSEIIVLFYKTELHQITDDRNLELLNCSVQNFAFLNTSHVNNIIIWVTQLERPEKNF
jgi:hypothetical protein